MRIAVIDDESIFRMQLKMMVGKIAASQELNLEVEEFESGPAFIDSLADRRYDIVFMDIFMPDMDGIATARKLRKLTARTFLIFMTASEGHYPEAFSLHAFDYVTKPFTIERISQVLKEIIEHTPMDESFIKIAVGPLDEKIYLKDIISVTTDGHYLEINRNDNTSIRARLTSGEFLELTGSDKRFIMINRGIIINMDYIDYVDGGDVNLMDKNIFPISARKVADITQQIKDYQFDKNR
ncbi:LytR/AlgR family response regulator transcription factor [Pseudobutyrivibrio sp.]|uniref:LytR/AlgR family response regulator transcription factor n=1 Tax=Pseudobutyrivibrio sp. TaxID=2014367 RepID=UPI001DE312E6|nr:LytTR family DNA-binding domain-containing protein [Pseudobutyrivibrio sp.]MBE5911343.1 response regulator transcription factor [Pseudobutyrivibrio sp.]